MFKPAVHAEGQFAEHRLVVAHDPVRATEQSAKRRTKIKELHVPVLQKSTATKLTRTTAVPSAAGIIVEPQSQATDRATCAHNAVATPAPSDSSNPPTDNTPPATARYAANPPTATSTSPTHIAPLASRSPINSSQE